MLELPQLLVLGAAAGVTALTWRYTCTFYAWQGAARVSGLDWRVGHGPFPGRLLGRLEGFGVEVRTLRGPHSRGRRSTEYVVHGQGRFPGVEFSYEGLPEQVRGLLANLGSVLAAAPIRWEGVLNGTGPAEAAGLDREARVRLILLGLGPEARLEDGSLILVQSGSPWRAGPILSTLLRILATAKALELEARRNPEPELSALRPRSTAVARKRRLELGTSGPPPSRPAPEPPAEADFDSKILASLPLRQICWRHLERIALAEDSEVGARMEATQRLIEEMPPERLTPLLASLVGSKRPRLRALAIRGLAELKETANAGEILALRNGADPETRAAIAEFLGATGGEGAESTLLELLQRPEPEVRLAAARALAAVGTLSAIEPLMACVEGTRRLLGGGLREAVQEAVKAIQTRLGGPTAGCLSIATPPPEHGELSMAHVDEGSLSMVAEEDLPSDSRSRAGEASPDQAT